MMKCTLFRKVNVGLDLFGKNVFTLNGEEIVLHSYVTKVFEWENFPFIFDWMLKHTLEMKKVNYVHQEWFQIDEVGHCELEDLEEDLEILIKDEPTSPNVDEWVRTLEMIKEEFQNWECDYLFQMTDFDDI